MTPKRVVVAMKIGAVKPGSVAAEGGGKKERKRKESLLETALRPVRTGGKEGGRRGEKGGKH